MIETIDFIRFAKFLGEAEGDEPPVEPPPVDLEADAIALITGEGALYNISDLSTLFSDRGGAAATTPAVVDGLVGTIKDKGPNARHKVAVTDARRGTLRLVDGIYYIETDGVDDSYNSVTLASSDYPMYAAGAYNKTASATVIDVESRAVAGTSYFGLRANANTPNCRTRQSGVLANVSAGTNSLPDGTWGVGEACATYTQVKCAINGGAFATGAIALLGTETMLGSLRTAMNETSNAQLVGLKYAGGIHLDYEPDATQRAKIVEFLTSLFF